MDSRNFSRTWVSLRLNFHAYYNHIYEKYTVVNVHEIRARNSILVFGYTSQTADNDTMGLHVLVSQVQYTNEPLQCKCGLKQDW